jgi:hypothetical protein
MTVYGYTRISTKIQADGGESLGVQSSIAWKHFSTAASLWAVGQQLANVGCVRVHTHGSAPGCRPH